MLIQGIGDEVISVLIALILITIVALLWNSTHVQERPAVRAVVIRAATISEGATQVLNQRQELLDALDATEIAQQPSPVVEDSVEEATEVESTVEEANSTTLSEERPEQPQPAAEETPPAVEENEGVLATIKVRFINETSLEIKSRLSEKLGRFISQHLDRHLNLCTDDRVRLIYNGRVLGRESTLAELGLTDNCVIHCLVQRSVEEAAHVNVNADDSLDLDLSNICYPLLGTCLMVIWWCQVVYAHYFNFTSTISLVSLTVLFFASMANTYFVRA
jgi:hypothetical protein